MKAMLFTMAVLRVGLRAAKCIVAIGERGRLGKQDSSIETMKATLFTTALRLVGIRRAESTAAIGERGRWGKRFSVVQV